MSILQVEQLVKTFGRRRVVDGVSLNVYRGEIVGLLGPNGAGKTTTFRMICGQLKPDRGKVTLAGKDVTEWPMFQRARHGGMGYLPQQSSIFAKLTVQQNLIAMMQLLKMDRKSQKRRCDELLAQFKIEKLRKSKAGKLSGGERRRLEIARCLVSNPEIIMLDEPFAGIDPVTVQNIQEVIQELREAGLSILITDHAAREILQITDRTYVVSEGNILCSGSADQIVQNEDVKTKYLGEIDFVRSERLDQKNRAPKPRFQTSQASSSGSKKSSRADSIKLEEVPQDEAFPSIARTAQLHRVDPVADDGYTDTKKTAPNSREIEPQTLENSSEIENAGTPDPIDVSTLPIRRPSFNRPDQLGEIEAPFNSKHLD